MPDLESAASRSRHDRHGPAIDPDTRRPRGDRRRALAEARAFWPSAFRRWRARRSWRAASASTRTRSNGDFVIDRHPGFDNVWLVGGGSGHGFKHGPAVGEYTAERVMKGDPTDARFSIATKDVVQKRTVH